MTWIRTVPPEEATGRLKLTYDAAVRRAGWVYNIVRAQSLNPPVLEASINLYLAVMHGSSTLSRADREMLATIVSQAANCFY